jgi:phage shock protein PspC (stress-responsive transcriptional regulator)
MATKILYRSKKNRIFSGVCGGLADYFDIDANIIRAIFVVLSAASGTGILLYLILATIVPVAGSRQHGLRDNFNDLADSLMTHARALRQEFASRSYSAPANHEIATKNRTRFNIGLIITFIGLVLLTGNFIPSAFNLFWSSAAWPVAILLIGLYLIKK